MRRRLAGSLVSLAALACAARDRPATFYVDSAQGQDAAAGTGPATAWQSLERVNQAELIPGDSVLFKRGGLWRGQLSPHSGRRDARIVYGAYGTGAKPILQGSVARDRPEDWAEVKPGIWATRPFTPDVLDELLDLRGTHWSSSFQESAHGTLTRIQEGDRAFYRVTCQAAGAKRSQIQLWGPELKPAAPCLVVRLRARATIPFKLDTVEALLNQPPWTCALRGAALRPTTIGPAWQDVDVLLQEQQAVASAHLHFSLGGLLPAGAVFDFEPRGVWRASLAHCDPIRGDVGILILNHGEKWGVKKWQLADLQAPLDYWYAPEEQRVYVACAGNPARRFASVELALTRHIVNEGGAHDVTYDGLAVRYGGAHGFGGGNTRRLTIRNCDVAWIGGGLQFFKPDGKPVRYGNGIEFWGAAQDNLVESNRLWEIYDAALTNQGKGDDSHQLNITYRDNIIWHAEYSFEFWNRPAAARTENILFEHNTCVDAGGGWAHAQRPDRNGAHLMFYQHPSASTNIVIRNNIFAGSSEVCLRMENDWRAAQTLSHNLYFQTDRPVVRWLAKRYFAPADFAQYQRELQMDAGSVCAEPRFIDAAAHDYRLRPESPGAALATDGGPMGARGTSP